MSASRTSRKARTAAGSYTARLERRYTTTSARPARPPSRPRRLLDLRVAAAVALAAELGHLAAAYVEWPGSSARGLFHVVVAGGLGLVAVGLYSGLSRSLLGPAAVFTVLIPVAGLAGAVLQASSFRLLPLPVAVLVSVAEVALAAAAFVRWAGTDRH